MPAFYWHSRRTCLFSRLSSSSVSKPTPEGPTTPTFTTTMDEFLASHFIRNPASMSSESATETLRHVVRGSRLPQLYPVWKQLARENVDSRFSPNKIPLHKYFHAPTCPKTRLYQFYPWETIMKEDVGYINSGHRPRVLPHEKPLLPNHEADFQQARSRLRESVSRTAQTAVIYPSRFGWVGLSIPCIVLHGKNTIQTEDIDTVVIHHHRGESLRHPQC
ncbi:hypothetical protein EX30DRAFT_383907 [Ascodesmis nigricans]|uniref:Uncharacterized protein n=1 Tax=Ascodesmis nigricans TaxID=341454 RepID=A0A4S2N0V3_9PEZI|nr:hypothetical protein EX30DRAFT_383907 [Ascodesmis nigricans]